HHRPSSHDQIPLLFFFGLCDIRKVSDDQAVPARKRRVQISSPRPRIPVLLLQSPRIDDEADPITKCDKHEAQSECIPRGCTLTVHIGTHFTPHSRTGSPCTGSPPAGRAVPVPALVWP